MTGRQDTLERKADVVNASGGIGYLMLNTRIWNDLADADVLTVAQLEQAVTDGTVRSLPRIGPKAVEKINQALSNYTPDPPTYVEHPIEVARRALMAAADLENGWSGFVSTSGRACAATA
jgi:hypothetical protein